MKDSDCDSLHSGWRGYLPLVTDTFTLSPKWATWDISAVIFIGKKAYSVCTQAPNSADGGGIQVSPSCLKWYVTTTRRPAVSLGNASRAARSSAAATSTPESVTSCPSWLICLRM